MSAVAPANATVTFMRTKVRRLTASSSESALATADIDQYLNNFYLNDFAYAIKVDQMRSIFTIFTIPNVDRYPVDVNYMQGMRSAIYVEGIQGAFVKDRMQFFNVWPRFPTQLQQGGTSISGIITAIAQPDPLTTVTSPNHNLTTGAVINIENVVGMTQLNGNNYTITFVDANNFTLGVDDTAFGAYVSGGTWSAISQTFSFQLAAPFLSREVVIGGTDTNGNAITINDDGYGNLNYLVPNPITSIPLSTTNPAIPGMYNINTGDPGLNNPTQIGTVNYVTGQIDFTLPSGISLSSGTLFNIWISQYQVGRPYSLLFWNNEITIRPVPDFVYKIEIETFLTPVQFMNITDVPILNQWAQYLAYGASMEILRDRQDMEGLENLREGFMRQEALVLERQSVEEINVPNYNLFNSSQYMLFGGNGAYGGFNQGIW
jgi:Ubiquitin-activating enzyme E1 FCCH domain